MRLKLEKICLISTIYLLVGYSVIYISTAKSGLGVSPKETVIVAPSFERSLDKKATKFEESTEELLELVRGYSKSGGIK